MVRLYWDLSLSGRHVHELRPGDERHGRRARHQDRRQDQVDQDRIAVPPMSARGSLAYAIAFAVFVAVALPLDRGTSLLEQSALGLTAWVFLAIALRLQPPAVRGQVATLVVLATVLELIGSIVWGAYRYRLENLPLYVPAGHGLFYLAALRVASLPLLERHARRIVIAVTAGATLWMVYGLARPPLPDLLGFVTCAIFLRFIVRGRFPLLSAVRR